MEEGRVFCVVVSETQIEKSRLDALGYVTGRPKVKGLDVLPVYLL